MQRRKSFPEISGPDCLAPGSCPLCSCGCLSALWADSAAFDVSDLAQTEIDGSFGIAAGSRAVKLHSAVVHVLPCQEPNLPLKL